MVAPTAPPRGSARGAALIGFVVGLAVVIAVGGVVGWRLGWFALPAPVQVLDSRPDSRFSQIELRGRNIYHANCAACHGAPVGGDMMDYPPKHNSNGHTWHHPDCELRQIIRDGGNEMTAAMREMMAPSGAVRMPAWKDKLSDGDIDAVLSYIKTMWFSYQQDAQAEVTRRSC